jgi:hypothetical protein
MMSHIVGYSSALLYRWDSGWRFLVAKVGPAARLTSRGNACSLVTVRAQR